MPCSEFVLKRDGTDVKTNNACVAESGNWVSPYDGVKFTAARDLDIDHMVPLKNAWIVRLLPNSFSPQFHLLCLTFLASPVPHNGPPSSAKLWPTTSPAPSFGLYQPMPTVARVTIAPMSGSLL